jgi:hypothetical protein
MGLNTKDAPSTLFFEKNRIVAFRKNGVTKKDKEPTGGKEYEEAEVFVVY